MILLQLVAGLFILIFIHELGHFIAAKLVGIEIEEFGIGFPPRIMELFEFWGTKFTLNWIPLGGFVRPKGENDPEIEGGLAAANPFARLFVLLSGPAMNLFAGVIIFAIIIARMGEPVFDQVVILEVKSGSPAEAMTTGRGSAMIRICRSERPMGRYMFTSAELTAATHSTRSQRRNSSTSRMWARSFALTPMNREAFVWWENMARLLNWLPRNQNI